MEDEIDVKEFMRKCKLGLRSVKEYLQDKSEEQIDQLRMDLLRKKGRREGWIPWLGSIPVVISVLSLIVSMVNKMSISKVDITSFYILLFLCFFIVVVYFIVTIAVGNKVEYEIALQYIDIFLKRQKKLKKKKSFTKEKYEKTNELKGEVIEPLLFATNALLFPWVINRRFRYNERLYDMAWQSFITGVITIIGSILWIAGIYVLIYRAGGMRCLGIMISTVGSLIILSGKGFSKETDSNKIYAYSACVIALISTIISLISVFK